MLQFAGDEAASNSQQLDGGRAHRRRLRRLSRVAGRVRRGVARPSPARCDAAVMRVPFIGVISLSLLFAAFVIWVGAAIVWKKRIQPKERT
jgi:hypothetical protein